MKKSALILSFMSMLAMIVYIAPTQTYALDTFTSQVSVTAQIETEYTATVDVFLQSYLSQYDNTNISDINSVTTIRNKIVTLLNSPTQIISNNNFFALEYLVFKIDIWSEGKIQMKEDLVNIFSDILEESKKVENWDILSVHYIWKLEDGTVFDTSRENTAKENGIYNEQRAYTPLEFIAWAWQMIAWFDSGVIWMKEWESKTITIEAKDGYGEYNPNSQNNHFLAGKTLIFEVEMVLIEK